MNILLTNDDGITAPGLWAAARVLGEFGTVLVVAPSGNCSGYGAALPPLPSLSYFPYRHGDQHPPRVTAYGLAGTPAACAQVGLSGVFGHAPFDMVFSGVNLGVNMGRDVFYSGTVGAALTAQLLGVSSIAMSLDAEMADLARWDATGWAIRQVMAMWLFRQDSEARLFNVNVPNRPASEIAGVRITSLGDHSFLDRYRFVPSAADPYTLSVIHMGEQRTRESGAGEPDGCTDARAVKEGYVSLTPLEPLPELLRVVPWYQRVDTVRADTARADTRRVNTTRVDAIEIDPTPTVTA